MIQRFWYNPSRMRTVDIFGILPRRPAMGGPSISQARKPQNVVACAIGGGYYEMQYMDAPLAGSLVAEQALTKDQVQQAAGQETIHWAEAGQCTPSGRIKPPQAAAPAPAASPSSQAPTPIPLSIDIQAFAPQYLQKTGIPQRVPFAAAVVAPPLPEEDVIPQAPPTNARWAPEAAAAPAEKAGITEFAIGGGIFAAGAAAIALFH